MEVELKLSYTGADGSALFERLAALPQIGGLSFGPARQLELVDLYYSSPGLQKAKGALRLRNQNGQPLITVKLAEAQQNGLFRREEYEEPLTEASFAKVMGLLIERGLIPPATYSAAAFLAGEGWGVVGPVLQTRSLRLERRGGGLSLTLDRVSYPGLSPTTYFDVEIEVVGGQPEQLAQVQAALVQLAGGQLVPASQSKLARGLDLRPMPK